MIARIRLKRSLKRLALYMSLRAMENAIDEMRRHNDGT